MRMRGVVPIVVGVLGSSLMPRERFLTWPNRLTMLRIVLIGPFVILLLNIQDVTWLWARHGALAIFAAMAMTDLFDGYLARRFNQESPLGRFLDPLADKLLITSAMILLGLEGTSVPGFRIASWVVVAAVGKDMFVVVGFLLVFIVTGRVFIRPGWSGKLCTDSQMALVVVVLVGPDFVLLGDLASDLIRTLMVVLWVASSLLAVLTCWQYFRIGMRFANESAVDSHG